MRPVLKHFALLMAGLTLSLALGHAHAAKVSNIASTKHNLSVSGPGPFKASSEKEVCVFCHTPHAATQLDQGLTGPPVVSPAAVNAPLWNRKVPAGATYTPYTSSSLDAQYITNSLSSEPGGSSKLCLSCHDGSLAIGEVNVLRGAGSATSSGTVVIAMSTPGGKMPAGSGNTTGFTRDLGVNLNNDHPISLTYNSALVTRDGELRALDGTQRYPATTGTVIGVRSSGYKPTLPLEPTGASGAGQVQCASCHDPHIRETDAAQGNQKFLRLNRFQVSSSGTTTSTLAEFNAANDIICMACHDKNGSSGSWSFSAHANDQVAQQTYTTAAATLREFPSALPVWRAACLNCHDTHSVPGARRLLREGTDSGTSPKEGGSSAIEETCYQCHTSTGTLILQTAGTGALAEVPPIKGDFALAIRMPITGTETHDIGGNFNDGGNANCASSNAINKCGKDFLESRLRLGQTDLINRHVECTDCHNPHRVIKGQNGLPGPLTTSNTNEKAGTHRHENAAGFIHSNIISGVLRGSWGVEPAYANASFHLAGTGTTALTTALTFTVKRGDPGSTAITTVGSDYVTREYQICLKCHSNYGYPDDNTYPNGSTRPQLGNTTGLTGSNPNGHLNFSRYTNQAKEFQAPSAHAFPAGSVSLGFDGGAGSSASVTATNSNNHRSWHPVMAPTGRTGRAGAFLSPWNNNTDANSIAGTAGRLGVQTMYCSDCHGSATGSATVMPNLNTNTDENGSPWGPHGSTNNFLLKGTWNTGSGEGDSNTLCFKCHNQSSYSGGSGGTGFRFSSSWSGFDDGHQLHANKIDTDMKCNFCHVAVPHGWKNRGLLVNLNDVGPEAGLPAGTSVSHPYTNGPYYRRAYLRIESFPSGTGWGPSNCGGKDNMRSACENGT